MAVKRKCAATARPSLTGRQRAGTVLLVWLMSLNGLPAMAAESPSARSARGQELWRAYQEQRYRHVSLGAAEYLRQEQPDDELRIAIANSHAWTGNYAEAIRHYELLEGSGYTREALLGRANAYRWAGQAALSVPLYRRYLEYDPHDSVARDGLVFAERELAASTRYRLGRIRDSDQVVRPWHSIGHRWRSDDSLELYEIEVGAGDDRRNDLGIRQRDLTIRYENLKLPLRPWVEISRQGDPASENFALARFTLDERPTRIYVGHVNWGKLAFTPEALRDGLAATRYGIETAMVNSLGQWRLAYDYYAVSDDNVIQEPGARFTPAWQPFPGHNMRWFLGLSSRLAKRNDPRYWSPVDDYYTLDLGYEAGWNARLYDFSFFVKRGFPLGGEARDSWGAGLAAKRWIGSWAFGVEGKASSGWRDDAGYRSRTWTATVEKRW